MPSRPEHDLTPWCRRLIDELTTQDARALAVAEGLTVAQLNWKPGPDAWSVGQCLEHLYITNKIYLAPIEVAMAGATISPVHVITPGWFGRLFIRKYIEPSPASGRSKAPRKIAPASVVEPSIAEQFVASNAEARDVMRRASQLDVNRIRFKNPFVAGIRFTIGTGFEIISKHQRRHLMQAEAVRQTL